ncbi:similar to Saccharomyces cerevisiae YJL151C SNA3 Integral membrane protein localized to vacuolar intralumenal vesicles [Maudiozyma barnettii]|uniref:Similar to Saccharomyces cerevisiae YJL151C SNA3 Integral membrane protein localized to vacuolar intralumenal vesicles n=1 Tax=Maudiozyma barnettii TaxID=61262 RepID=A0A8H2ZI35_9SACH|nr:Sna3p [Kazachstania barnettii]CAB4255122.1 similar to Saccharomyces cerevisiae YJL151C SNA3 Integral membrane protein localized to vacuolar intralumenal vesicles [Kazachstania barnettii]CAD1783393.1 similar to Saccharomyces cerevisiae YJL151C SNA3 Integral membrane protein localized to vacuolar intralumenal vesicles [Kazachstania barnettii]
MANESAKYSINKDDLLLIILGVFIPPVPVIIRKGFCSKDSLLNILLFMILFFPATIHSFYIVYESSRERDLERNNTTSTVDGRTLREDQVPLNNGDFNVDLERDAQDIQENSSSLPKYDEISHDNNPNTGDNKVQH